MTEHSTTRDNTDFRARIDYATRNAQQPTDIAYHRYQPFTPVSLTHRTWPDNVATSAPRSCAVDLIVRNHALIPPLSPRRRPPSETHPRVAYRICLGQAPTPRCIVGCH